MERLWKVRKTVQGMWAVYNEVSLLVECGTLETAVEWCWSYGAKPVVEDVIVNTEFACGDPRHFAGKAG